MKKGLLLSLAVLLVATGCGKSSNSNKITCTYDASEDGIEISAKITAEIKDEKVKDVTVSMELGNQEYADLLCELYQSASKDAVTCKGKEIIINDLSLMGDDIDSDELIGTSVQDFKDGLKEAGYTCK